MDMKTVPCKKLISASVSFLMIITVFISFSAGGSEGASGRSVKPFDQDMDGIDDRITLETPFPVWTFIHHEEDQGEMIYKDLERRGIQVHSVYDIIPVISARFVSISQIHDLLDLYPDCSIELHGSISLLQDVSIASIKASRSDEYSPRTAQDLGMNGDGVTIAIIDTGVDNEHPTFEGAFVAGVDLTVPGSPLTPRDGSFDPDDRTGHGTAVASIALGRGDENVQFRGAAPMAGLIDIKVAGNLPVQLNQNSMMDSLQWCMDHSDTHWGNGFEGVDIVSISLGIGDGSTAVSEAMDQLVSDGVVVVQGAGNSGSSYSQGPGTTWSDLSIVVGGIDDKDTVDRSDDEHWSSSTTGPRTDDGDQDNFDELRPDVVAPAVRITFASSSRNSLIQPASGWSEGSGTSYATPHMSGTAALMIQAKEAVRPQGQRNIIRNIVHQTAEPRGEPYDPSLSSTYNSKYGFGMLDAYEAVKSSLSYSGVNNRPFISYFEVKPNQTTPGTICRIRALAIDPDEEILEYDLTVDNGQLTGEAPIWEWVAPGEPGKYYFNLVVSDESGGTATAKTSVLVVEGAPNKPPVITSFRSSEDVIDIGTTATLNVVAIDQDGDPLTYSYDPRMGSIQGTGNEVQYTAPDQAMIDTVTVTVTDGKGGTDSEELSIEIREPSVNRPPQVTIVSAEPSVINITNFGLDKKLFAVVADPDGMDDIEQVIADLSAFSGSSGVEMKNDGVYPDEVEGDQWYSLLMPDLDDLDNGIYTVKVTVYDKSGESATGSSQVQVNLSGSQTEDIPIGRDSGPSPVMIGLIIVALILLISGVAGFFVIRGRRSRPQPPQQPPVYGSRFQPPVSQPPVQGSFRPVQRQP